MKSPKEWSVYLVRCADESLYTGIAKDVPARLEAHNAGRGAAYTRSRLPVRLVYHKKGLTRSAALIEEYRIKSLERPEKLALLKKAARAFAAAALLLTAAAPARAIPALTKELQILVSSAAPQAFTGDTGGAAYAPLRMYYLPAVSSAAPHASSGTAVLSATSVDGLVWVKEAGVRVDTNTVPSVSASSITGCSLLPLAGGGYRMLYSIVSTTGAFRIHSATSANGLGWANEASPRVDTGSTTYIGVPRLVKLTSGDWRMYYTRDFNGGDDLPDRQIYTTVSTDEGVTWSASSVVLATTAYESGAAKLTDGKIRLYYSQPQGAASSATVILSALSSDALGTTFAAEAGVRLSTPAATGAMSFPVPARSTDSFRWRLYYSYYQTFSSSGDVQSAATGAPNPTAITPSTIYQSAGSLPLVVSGEIFSTAPGVSIKQGGTTIVGTSVNRTDDQHITASFATTGQPLGPWDVIVTNSDGITGTATGALTMDFAPGSVDLTGNLLKPRLGVPTTIAVTIFNAGTVSVRIYDSEGRPIRTIFDDAHAAGAFNFTWDGRGASGSLVPSGLYFVAVNGPKLNIKGKIVVIR